LKKLIAATAVCVVAGIAGPAYAHTPTPSAHKNKPNATLSPSKGVKTGTAIHVKGTHGLKNTGYSCIQVILHHNTAGEGTANLTSIVSTTSNKKGAFKCTEVFKPFTGLDGSTSVACPPTKAEAKQGYSCAVGYFDSATSGNKSAGYTKFTAKK
jgi:hypothetical protein